MPTTLSYSILERLLLQSIKVSMKILDAVKTEAMLFRAHPRLSDAVKGSQGQSRAVKGRPIKCVFEFKYLGVVFDEHISWNSHVKYVLSRAGKQLGMLGRIRGNLTSVCANSIYTAYNYSSYHGLL